MSSVWLRILCIGTSFVSTFSKIGACCKIRANTLSKRKYVKMSCPNVLSSYFFFFRFFVSLFHRAAQLKHRAWSPPYATSFHQSSSPPSIEKLRVTGREKVAPHNAALDCRPVENLVILQRTVTRL